LTGGDIAQKFVHGQPDSEQPEAPTRVFYSVALVSPPPLVYRARLIDQTKTLNAELSKKALEKVGNPNILVNLISRRVRQLNSAGGTGSRKLIDTPASMGVGDIALLEIVEDKMGWEPIPDAPEELATPKKRRKG
jgi:DNA-directed RNA polymerase subunit K/omega